MDKPININDMHVTESFIRFQILSQGKEAARFFDGLEGDFAQYFFGNFAQSFFCRAQRSRFGTAGSSIGNIPIYLDLQPAEAGRKLKEQRSIAAIYMAIFVWMVSSSYQFIFVEPGFISAFFSVEAEIFFNKLFSLSV